MIDDPNQTNLPLLFEFDEPDSVASDLVPSIDHDPPKPEGGDAPCGTPAVGPAPKPPHYYSTAEVAAMFGRRPRTVRRWIATGRLKAIRVGKAVFVPETQIDFLVSGEVDWPDG